MHCGDILSAHRITLQFGDMGAKETLARNRICISPYYENGKKRALTLEIKCADK